MGSNRVIPASTSMPSVVQIHTPSGSISPPIPMSDMSSSIKTEPSTDLDVAMNRHCRSENWAESYQDLSSWCSATSASSPATCQTPATDETFANGIDFHGEIDFDLRKSEQIASIPLEEDSSFNWGVGDSASPTSSVLSAPSAEVSNPVLLKDCWWSEIERGKVVKELESSRPLPESTTIPVSSKNHFNLVTAAVVKEEAANIKENMNPIVVPQVLQQQQQQQQQQRPFLSDPIQMAELQRRFERIASIAQPGANSKAKAVELIKILKEQVAALNKKKLRSPAAVSDLHNYHARLRVEPSVPSASAAVEQPQEDVSSVPANSGDIFQSDPFEGLFSVPEAQTQEVTPVYGSGVSSEFVPLQHLFYQNAIVAPAFVQNTFHSSVPKFTPQEDSGSSALHGTDLFFEAHHEIMREAPKPQQFETLPQLQLPASQQPTFHSTNQMSAPMPNFIDSPSPATVKMDGGATTQRPPLRLNMPELDALSFDALLFGSPGAITGIPKVPVMSTPDVLKPLVDTPDPESFDLLSYLCDDKVSTPPVGLDGNPFRFPPSNISQNTPTVISTVTATEHKSNVMVVKPLTTEWVKEEEKVSETVAGNGNNMHVVVEVKPQIMPSALSDVEEDNLIETESAQRNSVEPIKEEQISPRPSRSSRKRKYSEDEFELSLSPSVDHTRFSRQRRTSSKYDSDEDFTLPVRKSRKKSITPITEDDDEDDVKPKRARAAATVKRGERTVSTSSESDRYRELRDRNNEASRKSRLTRKAREQELGSQADILNRENRILKVKVDEMENLVKKLREALLQSMMKKS